jgi:hypothetical protein
MRKVISSFAEKRLAGAGNAQQKRRLVQEVCLVAHDEVVGNRVLTEINTALDP